MRCKKGRLQKIIQDKVNIIGIYSELISYLKVKVDAFKGGQLRHYIKNWETLTSDQEILNTVRGDTIEFDSMPPARHFVYNTRIITSERHLLNIEIIDLLGKGIIVPSIVEDNEFLSRYLLRMIWNKYVTYRHFNPLAPRVAQRQHNFK